MGVFREKRRRDGGWYTPYQQDIDWLSYKRKTRSSATMKVGMILLWFVLLMIFA